MELQDSMMHGRILTHILRSDAPIKARTEFKDIYSKLSFKKGEEKNL